MKLLLPIIALAGLLTLDASGQRKETSPAAQDKTLLAEKAVVGQWIDLLKNPQEHWRTYRKNSFPTNGWSFQNGILSLGANAKAGDLISKEKFSDFELEFSWRISKAGNSGVKYFVLEDQGSAVGHEYQMIDDNGHPDAKLGPKRKTASLYDVLPPTNTTVKITPDWNDSRIRVLGNKIEHWLNGTKVLEFELGSAELGTAKQESKFKSVERYGTKFPGYLVLQDHNDPVEFRKIQVKRLSP
jgi:hypothetical protein